MRMNIQHNKSKIGVQNPIQMIFFHFLYQSIFKKSHFAFESIIIQIILKQTFYMELKVAEYDD